MDLKGKKVYLKEGLVEDNYPFLLGWFHDLEVMKYIGWARKGLALKNVSELKNFIAELEDGIIFGIYNYEDVFIGYTTFSDFREKEGCEFGIFILDTNYWGKGIGEEVTKLMLKYGFSILEMKKIVLTTSEFHVRAIDLYERVGFKKVELIPDDRTIFYNGEWVQSGTVVMEMENNI